MVEGLYEYNSATEMKFSDPYRKHTRGNWWWNKGQPPRQATLALKKGDTSMKKMSAALFLCLYPHLCSSIDTGTHH